MGWPPVTSPRYRSGPPDPGRGPGCKARRMEACAGEPAHRHIGLGVPRMEARLLPRGAPPGPVPDPLRRRAERLRDQRDPLPRAVRGGGGAVGRGDPPGLPVRGQGAPAAHPRAGASPGRGRRRVPRAVPRLAGPPRDPPRRRALPVPAHARRDDAALDGLLGCLPPGLPVALEFRHDSWDEPDGARADRGGGRHGLRARRPRARSSRACRPGRSAYVAPARRELLGRGAARAGASCWSARPRSAPCTRSRSTRASRPGNPHAGVGLAEWLVAATTPRQ